MRDRVKTSTPLLAVVIFASMLGGYGVYGAVASFAQPQQEPCYPPNSYPCSDLADLSLRKSADRGSATVGQGIDYDILIRNEGPTGADNVTLTDELPDQVTFDDASAASSGGGGSCSYDSGSHTVTCEWAHADNDDLMSATIETTADSSGTAVNDAFVESDADDPNFSNNDDSASTTITSGNTGGGGQPACNDNVDNDGDGKIDFDGNGDPSLKDPGCESASDDSESPDPSATPTPTPTPTSTGTPTPTPTPTDGERGPCNDGVDNDGDGRIDFPDDKGCSSGVDQDETREIRVKTRITLRKGKLGVFKGRVRSARNKCVAFRHVLLRHRRAGIIGETASRRRGRYKIDIGDPIKGSYRTFAQESRFTLKNGDTLVCLPARSRAVRLRR